MECLYSDFDFLLDSLRIHDVNWNYAMQTHPSDVANVRGLCFNCQYLRNRGSSCNLCKLVCAERAPDSHSKCHVKEDFSYTREECRELLQKTITKALQKEVKFRQELTKIKRAIEKSAEKMKLSIEEEKNELLADVDNIMDKKLLSWKEQMSSIFLVSEKLLDMSEILGTVAVFSNEMKLLRNKIKNLTEEDMISFVSEKYECPKLGKIKVTPHSNGWKTTVYVVDEAISKTLNTFCLTLWNSQSGKNVILDYKLSVTLRDERENPVFVQVENFKDGTYVIDFYPKQVGSLSLSVMANSAPILYKMIRVTEGPKMMMKPILTFGKEGTQNGEFARPWGIHCDSYGRILVADRCNHRIQIFDEDGNFSRSIGTHGSAPGQLDRPAGITVGGYNLIIVADKDNHRIQIFDSVGSYVNHFREVGDEDELRYPWDVAFNPVERQIAVTEEKNRRVVLFSDRGQVLATFPFGSDKAFGLPRGITYCTDGSFLVTDFVCHRLAKFDKNLRSIGFFGQKGENPKEFFRPQGVTMREDGTFAVADCKNHRIQVFKRDKIHRVIGGFGNNLGEMDAPQGVAFDRRGALLVVDYGNSRIQIFKID